MYRAIVVFSGLVMGIFLIVGCDGGFTGGVDVPIGNPNITIEEGDVNVHVDQTQDNDQAVEVPQDQETDVGAEDEQGGNKIPICHIPPGNPDRAHTIWVSEAALPAHLAHGDFLGPCDCEWGNVQDCDDDLCADEECIAGECIYTLIECDDGDLCTTDWCDPETGECVFQDIECEDEDLCTMDWCDPDTGECVFDPIVCDDEDLCTTDECVDGDCVYTPIVCDDEGLCTTDECVEGECVYTPVECPEGEVCDPDTGECIPWCETDDDCPDDGLFCTGDPVCVDGVCGFSGDPCVDDGLLCDEEKNACVECLTDDDCPQGQVCDLDTGECREPGCVLEYSEDFSPCPDWETDQPDNYFCDSGAFHATTENAEPCYSPSRYAYTLIDYDGNSMKLEFDITSIDLQWSAGVAFGLFDENLMIFPDPDDPRDPHYIHAHPGRGDLGRRIDFYVRGANGVPQVRNMLYGSVLDGICYHCVLEYDSAADTAALTVTYCDTGESVDAVQISGIGGLPADLDYLGFARDPCGNCCCDPGWCSGYSCSNEATADLDNVRFCEYEGGE